MANFKAFYRNKTAMVEADTSYSAQIKAAAFFKAKKSWEVSIMNVDITHSTASL